MKKIYIIRHGETDNNQARVSGQPHDPLSKRGENQASLVADRLTELEIEIVYGSVYKRAAHTAQIIADILHVPLELTPLFVESKNASAVLGKSLDDPEANAIRAELKAHWGDPNWKHSDEENFFDVSARAQEALNFLASQQADNIVVVTHGAFARMLVWKILLGDLLTPALSTQLYPRVVTHNTGVTVAEFTNDAWKLIRFNDTVHLDPENSTWQ